MMGENPLHGGPDQQHRDMISRWVHEHAPSLRGFLLAIVRRTDVADDLLQAVFERAWQARERYRDDGRERAYLLTIADRQACDWARRARREVCLADDAWVGLEPAAGEPEPLELLVQDELRSDLAAALDRLTLGQRRVLLLRYYGNLEFSEIAAALDAPLGTVLSHCRRGLIALKNLLAESSP